MSQPAEPPPEGAKHVIIPAYSNQEDGDNTSIVLLLDANFIDLLKERQFAFGLDLATDAGVLRKVFLQPHGLFFAYYTHEPDEPIDPPDEITELCRHMGVPDGDDGVVVLVPALMAELHVGNEVFWFEWSGGELMSGGTEIYYTESIELKDLPSLEGPGEEDP